jgi:sec-independent protein translocase protein TatB
MFDISWAKLLVIGLVALIFIGPKELPEMMQNLGRMLGKLRRTADDFRRQFEDSVKDSGYQDLQKNLHDFRQLNPMNQLKASIERAMTETPPAPPVASPAAPADTTASAAASSYAATSHDVTATAVTHDATASAATPHGPAHVPTADVQAPAEPAPAPAPPSTTTASHLNGSQPHKPNDTAPQTAA